MGPMELGTKNHCAGENQLIANGAEPFLRSCQLCSYSRTSQHYMEHEGSLPCSQEPSTGPYPEPDQSNPYHPISLRWDFGEGQYHIFIPSKFCTCFKMGSPLRRQEGLTTSGHSPSIGGDSSGHSLTNWPFPPHTHTPFDIFNVYL
jgi:hypothetical protein